MKSGNPQLRSNCTDCSEFFRWAVGGCSSSRDSQSFGHATETGFFSGYTYLPVSNLNRAMTARKVSTAIRPRKWQPAKMPSLPTLDSDVGTPTRHTS